MYAALIKGEVEKDTRSDDEEEDLPEVAADEKKTK